MNQLPRRMAIGEGVALSMLSLSDAQALYDLVDSNRAHLRRWLSFVDDYNSAQAAESFIQKFVEKAKAGEGAAFGVLSDQHLAGVVTYDRIEMREKWALIGFWLAATFQRKGIVTRACKTLVDYAFENLTLSRVEIRCTVGNIRCRRVPERLGFRLVRVVPHDEWLHDHYEDTAVYAKEASKHTL